MTFKAQTQTCLFDLEVFWYISLFEIKSCTVTEIQSWASSQRVLNNFAFAIGNITLNVVTSWRSWWLCRQEVNSGVVKNHQQTT